MSHYKNRFNRILFLITGIGSFVWFLLRVLPKPSRASYPCMRVAAPLASTFVLWIIGLCSASLFLKRVRTHFIASRYVIGIACAIAGGIFSALIITSNQPSNAAQSVSTAFVPNDPIGVAKGICPGRVVWSHDSSATTWQGSGFGHWWQNENTNQTKVDTMLSRTLVTLCNKPTPSGAWDTLFKHFNSTHGNEVHGYRAGEKIFIKTNFTSTNHLKDWCAVDTTTYSFVNKADFFNTSPQIVRALLRQLVYVVGVKQDDIAVGDPVCYYPNEYYDSCHTEFPNVKYIDYGGKFGRTKVSYSTIPMHWSSRPNGVKQDYIEKHLADATYIINCAVLKSHRGNGITLGAKNHYGSFIRLPVDSGYYDLHQSLPFMTPEMGSYRALVDIMGHDHIGRKTILYLVDGLYSQNHNLDTIPRKWKIAPFNNSWSASIFASQDPVAI